jgi:hypothetical protein
MQWAWTFGQGVDLIPLALSAPPGLDVEQLITLAFSSFLQAVREHECDDHHQPDIR